MYTLGRGTDGPHARQSTREAPSAPAGPQRGGANQQNENRAKRPRRAAGETDKSRHGWRLALNPPDPAQDPAGQPLGTAHGGDTHSSKRPRAPCRDGRAPTSTNSSHLESHRVCDQSRDQHWGGHGRVSKRWGNKPQVNRPSLRRKPGTGWSGKEAQPSKHMRRGGWDGLGGEECGVQGRERHPEHVRQGEQPLVSSQGPHRKEGRKEGRDKEKK